MSEQTAPEPETTEGSNVKKESADAVKSAETEVTAARQRSRPAGALGRYLGLFLAFQVGSAMVVALLYWLLQFFFDFPMTSTTYVTPALWLTAFGAALFAAAAYGRDHGHGPRNEVRTKLVAGTFGVALLFSAVVYAALWLVADQPWFSTYSFWAIAVSVLVLLLKVAVLFLAVLAGYFYASARAERARTAGRLTRGLFWTSIVALVAAASAFLGFGFTGVKAYLGLTSGTAQIRDDSVDVAEQAILNTLNIDVKDLDGWKKSLESTMSGEALKQATDDQSMKMLEDAAKSSGKEPEVTGKITRSGVTAVDTAENSATVLVFAVASTTAFGTDEPQVVPMNFLVTVTEQDGERKASHIVPLSGINYVEEAERQAGSGSDSGSTTEGESSDDGSSGSGTGDEQDSGSDESGSDGSADGDSAGETEGGN